MKLSLICRCCVAVKSDSARQLAPSAMRVAPCTQLARDASTASARKLRHERGSEPTKLRHVSLS